MAWTVARSGSDSFRTDESSEPTIQRHYSIRGETTITASCSRSEGWRFQNQSEPCSAGGARVLVGSRGGEPEPLVGAGAPEGSSLRKKGAFQTPALFDYAKGRDANLKVNERR